MLIRRRSASGCFDCTYIYRSSTELTKRPRKIKESHDDSNIVYDMQSEEEFIALYQNWDAVDKSLFPEPGPLGAPFEFGWKRELVFRATSGQSKEKGDVYYITPMGRKLRTRNEIQSNLTPGLTMDNFSLSKVPLYLGPEYEIVRTAKMKSTVKVPSPRVFSPQLGKRIPKPKAPKGASPPHSPQIISVRSGIRVRRAHMNYFGQLIHFPSFNFQVTPKSMTVVKPLGTGSSSTPLTTPKRVPGQVTPQITK